MFIMHLLHFYQLLVEAKITVSARGILATPLGLTLSFLVHKYKGKCFVAVVFFGQKPKNFIKINQKLCFPYLFSSI